MDVGVIGGGPGGLYFALLLKQAAPGHRVRVVERNQADDTFGWGVVFSDETLGHFLAVDEPTHRGITQAFVHWDAIDIDWKGEVLRSRGHGFSGIARKRLLQLLQARCRELGVELEFGREVGVEAFAGADLVVAADGVNSRTRAAMADRVRPHIEPGRNKFIWLGTRRVFDAFKFFVRDTEHGLFQAHAYPFDAETSTFIVETDLAAWRGAGLDRASAAESIGFCETLFADVLAGERLASNRSGWIEFLQVHCETWHDERVVLLGDAAHTAHFSIGSGTKLAMEDAIALVRAIGEHPGDIPAALRSYEAARWLEVAKLQRSAITSQRWFEGIRRYRRAPALQVAVSLLTRSKRVTHESLRRRDPAFVDEVDRFVARERGLVAEPPPPPMFTPFRLRGLELANRVVVSPMCMYSATEGSVGDFHVAHLGRLALGGAGLVIAEMTDVTAHGRITPGCAGLYHDDHVSAWRRVTELVHAQSNAKIGIQLGHAGRKAATTTPWEGSRPLANGWEPVAPSSIPYTAEDRVPRAMTEADLADTLAAYVAATERALAAGFDLVEVHMAHGYLLSSFLSPLTNHRTDEYGGALVGRLRFPLRVLAAVRAAWPASKPVSVRISAVDWAPGGTTEDDAVEIAHALAEHGADLIDVSSGSVVPEQSPVYGRMFQTPFADRIRHDVGIATMAVGAIQNWDHVNTIIASGRADLCALARPHLFDPAFTLHAAAAQGYEGEAATWPVQYLRGAKS